MAGQGGELVLRLENSLTYARRPTATNSRRSKHEKQAKTERLDTALDFVQCPLVNAGNSYHHSGLEPFF